MQRRSLLASLAASSAALAGCQTKSSGGSDTTTSPTTKSPGSDETTQPPDNQWPQQLASVVTLDTQPRRLSVFPTSYHSQDGGEVSIEFEKRATSEHPAVLRVVLRNDNDFSNVFRLPDHAPLDRTPGFYPEAQRWPGMDEPPEDARRLYLAPLRNQSLPKSAPAVERDPSGVWRLAENASGPWLPATRRLDPGESLTVSFALVSAADGRGPFTELRRRKRLPRDQHLTLATWNSDHPGPDADSRFSDERFPSLPSQGDENREPPTWFHEAEGDQTVYIRPQTEHSELPKTLRFALVNHDTEPATGNPYFWELYKLVDGAWHKVAPWMYPMPMGAVSPGDVKVYRLLASHGESLPCSDGRSIGRLGGGTYAFRAGMSVENRTHAAVFELDAAPVDVEPTDGVETTREDDTVTVTSPAWEAGHGRGVVTVERAGAADGVLVPELAARRDAYRNTLPFFVDDVTRVRLQTGDSVARTAQDAGAVRFRGETYSYTGTELAD